MTFPSGNGNPCCGSQRDFAHGAVHVRIEKQRAEIKATKFTSVDTQASVLSMPHGKVSDASLSGSGPRALLKRIFKIETWVPIFHGSF